MKNRSSRRNGAKIGTSGLVTSFAGASRPPVPRRFFPLLLRIATHVGALIPLAVLIWDFQTNHLTENPIQAAEQRTGIIALVLLLLSLACTPLNTLFRFSQAIQRRRALGLYAFFYASLHLFIFTVIDFGLDWATLWQMLAEKRYIIAGLATFVILVALAATSFRWSMKRMGRGWKRLHQLVYLAGVLAIIHFAWVVKGSVTRLGGDVLRPILYGSVLALLLALRIPVVRRAVVRGRQRVINGIKKDLTPVPFPKREGVPSKEQGSPKFFSYPPFPRREGGPGG